MPFRAVNFSELLVAEVDAGEDLAGRQGDVVLAIARREGLPPAGLRHLGDGVCVRQEILKRVIAVDIGGRGEKACGQWL